MFFLRSLVKQKDALAKKIALEDTPATDLHPLAKKIVALLPDHETLTLSQIVKLTKGKPSTVKLRLKELVEKGYLVPKGQGAWGALSAAYGRKIWLTVMLKVLQHHEACAWDLFSQRPRIPNSRASIAALACPPLQHLVHSGINILKHRACCILLRRSPGGWSEVI